MARGLFCCVGRPICWAYAVASDASVDGPGVSRLTPQHPPSQLSPLFHTHTDEYGSLTKYLPCFAATLPSLPIRVSCLLICHVRRCGLGVVCAAQGWGRRTVPVHHNHASAPANEEEKVPSKRNPQKQSQQG